MPSGTSEPRDLEVGSSPGKGEETHTSGGMLEQGDTHPTQRAWPGAGSQQAGDSTLLRPPLGRRSWGKGGQSVLSQTWQRDLVKKCYKTTKKGKNL